MCKNTFLFLMLLISYDEACYKGNKVKVQKETETQIFQSPGLLHFLSVPTCKLCKV